MADKVLNNDERLPVHSSWMRGMLRKGERRNIEPQHNNTTPTEEPMRPCCLLIMLIVVPDVVELRVEPRLFLSFTCLTFSKWL